MDAVAIKNDLPDAEPVYDVEQSRTRIAFRISSDLHFVNCVVWEAEAFLHRLGAHARGFSIVLRELLGNAIRHGNRNDPSRFVTCSVEKTEDGFIRICVEDEGRGFAYHLLHARVPEASKGIRNRGYAVIGVFSERLEFNPMGNRVSVCLRIQDSEVPASA